MASFMDNLKEKVKTNPKTIVLAEGYDEIFNSSIPAILLCIEKFYKNSNNS